MTICQLLLILSGNPVIFALPGSHRVTVIRLHPKYLVLREELAEELGSVQACGTFLCAGIHSSVFDAPCKTSAHVSIKSL